VLLKYSRKPERNTTHGRLRKIEGGDRQERMFPRIKEILGFLKRWDFFAKHPQGDFQQNRPQLAVHERRLQGCPVGETFCRWKPI
jgi:hypothetical protein